MSSLLALLLAAFLLALVEARNRGHPIKATSLLAFKPPSVSIGGKLRPRQSGESFVGNGGSSAAEIFNDDDFSWLDPIIQQQLWAAAAGGEKTASHLLAKRAPARIGDPLYQPDCLGCVKSGLGLDVDTNTYTWQIMQNQMIDGVINQMFDSCVFYTGLPPEDVVALGASPNSIYFGTSPKDQSRAATVFACAKSVKSIWLLWPGKNNNYDQSQSTLGKRNFYELRRGSWLDPLYFEDSDTDQHKADARARQAHYFRAMSQAMAESCKGITYVMAVQLTAMNRYIGIWPDTEYPALWRLHNQNPPIVTRLIGIDATNPTIQYEMQFNDPNGPNPNWPTVVSRLPTSDPGYLHFVELSEDELAAANGTSRLLKRDACTANVDYSDATPWDWFG